MKLSFHGADRAVTGSCHLIEAAGRSVLVDCGLIQGSRELDEENAAEFGFDPRAIDAVVLTHAHLDHCGRLPLLVKRGIPRRDRRHRRDPRPDAPGLLDAAHLQEEDARRRQSHARRRGSSEGGEPLYTLLDVFDTLDRFGRPLAYGKPLDLVPGIRATAFDAGHILGSASILIETAEAGAPPSCAFFRGHRQFRPAAARFALRA